MTDNVRALATRQTAPIALRNDNMDTLTVAKMLAESGFFGEVRQAGQALAKMLAGQELGMGPIASLMGVYYQQGKVTYSANIMAAAVKKTGQYTYRVKTIGTAACAIEFFERQGGAWETLGLSEFTIQDAEQAGLTTGANKHNWKNYPRNMLFARAMSNGVKWFTPDIFGGITPYTPDELGDEVVITPDGEMKPVVEGKVVEPPELCDAEHWNRVWHAAVKGSRFDDDDTRHKFIAYHTGGEFNSLTKFLESASTVMAEALVVAIKERIEHEVKRAQRDRALLISQLEDAVRQIEAMDGSFSIPDDILDIPDAEIREMLGNARLTIETAEAMNEAGVPA